MLHEIGREPTPEELAEKLGMPLEKVRKVLKIAKEPLSLETPIGDEEDSHLGDFIEDKNAILPIDAAIQSNLRETTTRVLASLTPREERVLRMRFGIGMNTDHTLEEVGQQFSVTRERIRQIEAKALRKLKHPSRITEAAELPRQLTVARRPLNVPSPLAGEGNTAGSAKLEWVRGQRRRGRRPLTHSLCGEPLRPPSPARGEGTGGEHRAVSKRQGPATPRSRDERTSSHGGRAIARRPAYFTFIIFSGLAPTRAMLLIASGARPDFSAISRSCSIMKPRAGSSFSSPPSSSAGTRRLERCEPSS